MTSTIDPKEVEKFSAIADEWWNENGKFKPLHKFNPIRISFLREAIVEHFSLDKKSIKPLCDLKILDIGCGGGLIAEPFARMGAGITAIDASGKNIQIAKIHSEKSGLKIDYRTTSAEKIEGEMFDVVFALEIIEHVADAKAFVESCSKLVKKDGLIFIATMNRTIKSLLLAKFSAEYLLRWLPVGTHDWNKFLKPSEVVFLAESCGLNLKSLSGFNYNILRDEWKRSNDLSVNYVAAFKL